MQTYLVLDMPRWLRHIVKPAPVLETVVGSTKVAIDVLLKSGAKNNQRTDGGVDEYAEDCLAMANFYNGPL